MHEVKKYPWVKDDRLSKDYVRYGRGDTARVLGVHRNTILNCTRQYPEFRKAPVIAEVSSCLPALEEEISRIEVEMNKNKISIGF